MTKSDASQATDAPAFLTIDARVPAPIRDLIGEAEGCVKNAYLTGGTACAQRAIQMLLTAERADGPDIEARVRTLAEKHPGLPQILTTVLQRFGDATARDGAKLSAAGLNALVATLKAILYEIYVLGPERMQRLDYVRKAIDSIERKKEDKRSGGPAGDHIPPVAASA
jgi:hypothetical protein